MYMCTLTLLLGTPVFPMRLKLYIYSSVSDEAEPVHLICGESCCGLRVPVESCIIMSVYSEGRGSVSSLVLLGDSGGVVNSLDFCPASLKSLGCFYFRCVLSSQWK